MLEGVEQIPWTTVGHHVYGDPDRIPRALRELMAADEEARKEARDFLFGEGQDFGDIYETTPLLIPFACEVLADTATPDRAALLEHLAAVADHTAVTHVLSVCALRLCLATYDAFRQQVDVLTGLLGDPDRAVRRVTAGILATLAGDADIVLPILVTAFRQEQHPSVQTALLQGCKQVLHALDWRQASLRAATAPFVREALRRAEPHWLPVAAARVAVELIATDYGAVKGLPNEAIERLLADEIFALTCPLTETEALGARWHQQYVVRDLARLNWEALLPLLQHPALTPDSAHLITRALLLAVFNHRYAEEAFWNAHATYTTAGIFYPPPYGGSPWAAPARQAQWQEALQVVLAADQVWSQPTNLFSRFFGLPDSREDLQALLSTNRIYPA